MDELMHQKESIAKIQQKIKKISGMIEEIDQDPNKGEWDVQTKRVLSNILNDYRSVLKWTQGNEWRSIQQMKKCFAFENETILLRDPREEDKDAFASGFGKLEHQENAFNIWDSVFVEKTWFCSIVDRQEQKYVGYVEIKDMSQALWEIGISILPQYRHMGFGSQSIPLFIESLRDKIGDKDFRLKVMADNLPSQGLMDKIGAKLVGITTMPTVFGVNEEAVEKETQWITGHMEALAMQLHIDSRKLLSHPLDYRI